MTEQFNEQEWLVRRAEGDVVTVAALSEDERKAVLCRMMEQVELVTTQLDTTCKVLHEWTFGDLELAEAEQCAAQQCEGDPYEPSDWLWVVSPGKQKLVSDMSTQELGQALCQCAKLLKHVRQVAQDVQVLLAE